MNIRLVMNLLGRLLLVESILPLPVLLIALADKTSDVNAVGISMVITAAFGAMMDSWRQRIYQLLMQNSLNDFTISALRADATGELQTLRQRVDMMAANPGAYARRLAMKY